jgi:guanylate kinase
MSDTAGTPEGSAGRQLEPPGKLVIISGPSGAGKTSVVRRLLTECPLPLTLSVSATTRPPRAGEVDGRDYYFLSTEQFQERRQRGDFLECAEVFGRGYWYGTLRRTVTEGLDAGQWVVLEIDVQGMQAVAALYPEAVTFFVRPPSLSELQHRLRQRGTDSEEAIQRRLKVAEHEWQFAATYQHQIINLQLEDAVNQICRILCQLVEKP